MYAVSAKTQKRSPRNAREGSDTDEFTTMSVLWV